MKFTLLVLYMLNGSYSVDIAKDLDRGECEYARSIIINDHAYVPNSTLITALCVPRDRDLPVPLL